MGRGDRDQMTQRSTRESARLWTLSLPAVTLLALFFALPVAAVAVDALREGTAAFARVFAASGFLRALGGSLALTLVALFATWMAWRVRAKRAESVAAA